MWRARCPTSPYEIFVRHSLQLRSDPLDGNYWNFGTREGKAHPLNNSVQIGQAWRKLILATCNHSRNDRPHEEFHFVFLSLDGFDQSKLGSAAVKIVSLTMYIEVGIAYQVVR